MSHFEIDDEKLARQIADRLQEAVSAEMAQYLITHSLIGIDAACEYLGTGRSRLHELASRGAIRSVKVGRERKFRLAWLDEYVDQQEKNRG